MSCPKRHRSENVALNGRQLALAVVTEYLGGDPPKEEDMPPNLRGFFRREFEDPPAPNEESGTWPDRIRNAKHIDFEDNKAHITTTTNEKWTVTSKNHRQTLLKMLMVRPGLCGNSCEDEGEVGLLIARWKDILEL